MLSFGLAESLPVPHDEVMSKAKVPAVQSLTPTEIEALLSALRKRFEEKRVVRKSIAWTSVESRLRSSDKLRSLGEMERTGGEPDVVGQDKTSGGFLFMDCAIESPAGRRSVCYDRAGWLSRKEARPETTAMDLAEEMGAELLSEADYVALQKVGVFDLKTSSWIATPPEIREKGGALYAERRYGRVFIGHNGAQSYYAVRGFRCRLVV